jgi:hypothetical protein
LPTGHTLIGSLIQRDKLLENERREVKILPALFFLGETTDNTDNDDVAEAFDSFATANPFLADEASNSTSLRPISALSEIRDIRAIRGF